MNILVTGGAGYRRSHYHRTVSHRRLRSGGR